jgi:hypothetical protein
MDEYHYNRFLTLSRNSPTRKKPKKLKKKVKKSNDVLLSKTKVNFADDRKCNNVSKSGLNFWKNLERTFVFCPNCKTCVSPTHVSYKR